ncbi:hypothetical protein BGZ97_008949 [Linnemannia gamsii]|uniref:Uncharacterized protein n=1 Tax=Linnemannia gamsii TaxID=64522 RepID=A0A9P6QQR2_9FUNG|nr:hypothetical protein BGZ97_008949 [Linnemannia gamsii]
MKSFAAIIFATVAVLAVTSAVPVPEDYDGTTTPGTLKDTRNQDCKKPIQKIFDDCRDTAVACNDAYQAANKICDTNFPTSIS